MPVFVAYRVISKPFRELEREGEAIRQAGEPAEWNELIASAASDDDNAAPLYQQAFALLYAGRQQEKDALSDFVHPDPQRAHAADCDTVRRLLAKNQQALALVRQAIRKLVCRFPVDWDPINAQFPQHTKLRHCVRFMVVDALLKHQSGDPEDAIAALRPALQLARQMETEHPPLLIQLLVRTAYYFIACRAFQRILQDTDVSPQTCQTLLHDLEGHNIKPCLTRSLIGERCTWRSER